MDRAALRYNEASTCGGDNMTVIRSVCSFYLKTGRMEEVGPLLETVVRAASKGTPADVELARQSLAYVLSATTDFTRFRRALDLVGVKLDEDGKLVREAVSEDSTDAIRAKVRVCSHAATGTIPPCAIELLVQLKDRQSLLPDDRFVLALLYEGQGDATGWRKARDELEPICRPIGNGPLGVPERSACATLGRFVQGLIRHKDLVEAAAWLKISRRWKSSANEAERLWFGSKCRRDCSRCKSGATKCWTCCALTSPDREAQPAEGLLVLASYQRQLRFKEGFTFLNEIRDKIVPEVAGGYYVSLMYGMKPSDADCQGVETWLKVQIAQRDKEASTLPSPRAQQDAKSRGMAMQMHLAALYRPARPLSRRGGAVQGHLLVEPNNVVALNNLAWLRAEQQTGEGAAALQDINTAIAGMGLNRCCWTRGSAYLVLNQNGKVLADFKEAAEDAPC